MSLIGMLGALANKNIASILDALLFGSIAGFLIGIPMTIISKKE